MPSDTTESVREMLKSGVQEDIESSKLDTDSTSRPEDSHEAEMVKPGGTDTLSNYDKALLADVDTTSFTSPEAQAEFLKARKNYDRGVAKKLASVDQEKAKMEARIRELEGSRTRTPETPTVSKETKEALKGIDRAIAKTDDPAVRKQLQESKEMILEEAERVAEARLKPLQERLQRLEGLAGRYRAGTLTEAFDALEGDYGAPLVEKYRPRLEDAARQYPDAELEQLFSAIVPAKEIREVLQTKRSTDQPKARGGLKSPTVSKESDTGGAEDAKKFFHPKRGWDIRNLMKSEVAKDLS